MTGWLELKAVEVPSEIKIEASQITWIQRHRSYVPCHLLIQIRDVICFVRSSWVGVMNGPRKFEALAESVRFSNDDMRSKLPALLSEATKYH